MLIKRKRFSEDEQKEFGARERKQRRKVARAEQNAEMHANKAAKRAVVAAEKQVPANVVNQKPAVAEVVNSIKNTTKEGVKNAGKLLRKNKKAVAIGAGVAATGAGLAAMIKKNKD
jgi:hypothetical protein